MKIQNDEKEKNVCIFPWSMLNAINKDKKNNLRVCILLCNKKTYHNLFFWLVNRKYVFKKKTLEPEKNM